MANTRNRPDKDGWARTVFERNRKIIFATQSICGICGGPVDFSVRYPDPFSPCIDHIVPISRGGSPCGMDNLQLAHRVCNRQKSDHMPPERGKQPAGNRDLPQSRDWRQFRAGQG